MSTSVVGGASGPWLRIASLCLLSLSACAPHPSTAPARPPVTASAIPSPAGARPLSPPHYVAGHSVYEITTVGTVSAAEDSASRLDTITTIATLTYDARWSAAELHVSGQVAARVASATAGLRGTSQTTMAPVAFRATIDSATGGVTVVPESSATTATCISGGPTVDQARQLATTRPRFLTPNAGWHDTVTDTSCLGGLPLVSRATRFYTVAGETAADPLTGAPAVLITHTSHTTMQGGGRRGAQVITLAGSGSGTTEEYYDRTSGVLLSAHTSAALALDVGVGGRVQRLHQQADWRARLTQHSG